MTEIIMAEYQDYLNFTHKKVCGGCGGEFPNGTSFRKNLGIEMCPECDAEVERVMGDENL